MAGSLGAWTSACCGGGTKERGIKTCLVLVSFCAAQIKGGRKGETGQLPLSLGSWGLRQAQKRGPKPLCLPAGRIWGVLFPSLLLWDFTRWQQRGGKAPVSGQIPAEPGALLLAPLPQPAPRCAGLGIGPSSSSGCPVTVPGVTLPAQPALPPPVPPLESTRPGPRCSANATRGALCSPAPFPSSPLLSGSPAPGRLCPPHPLPRRPPPLEALQREGGKKKTKQKTSRGGRHEQHRGGLQLRLQG